MEGGGGKNDEHETKTTLRNTKTRPQVERQYPLNLSILISGGKETNRDSLSSGERSGKSPSSESGRASSFVPRIVVSWQGIAEATALGKSPLEKGAREGDSPVHWSSVFFGRLDHA